MLALPIAARELLVLSRAATTWRSRFGTSVAVLFLGIIFLVMFNNAGQMALNVLMRLVGASLSLICVFTGLWLTADSIAEEKRTGTLGLLFLTNLVPFEIVLGKLLAHTARGFYTVICALPLLSMSMIFGGMRFGDVLLYLISALNLLCFSAAVGLFASSICRDKTRASTLGVLIVLFCWFGPPLLPVLLHFANAPLWLIESVGRVSLNPVGAGLGRLPSATSTWWSLAFTQMFAWAFIGLATWRLGRWQEEPSAKRWRLRDAWKAICYGGPAARLKLRRKLLDRNPFMWLASRDRLQIIGVWIVSLSVIVFVIFHVFRGPLPPLLPIGTAIIIGWFLQLAFCQAATAQLLREYEQGTLELILSTPLSAHELIQGQIAAARRRCGNLFGTAFVLFWMGLLLLAWQRAPGLVLAALAVYSGLFLLQFQVLGWVSIWSVVKAREPKKATSNGFFLVAILPGMILGAMLVSFQFLIWLISTQFPWVFAGLRFSPGLKVLLPLFFILAFVNCIYWLSRAKRELPHELRLFAFRRYTARESLTFFGQMGKLAGQAIRGMRRPKRLKPAQ